MYRTVIQIKSDVGDSTLRQLKNIIEMAFSNRVGTVANISNEPHHFEFIGGEKERGCLDIGILILKDDKTFLQNVTSWWWLDDEYPEESCDALKEFSIPVK